MEITASTDRPQVSGSPFSAKHSRRTSTPKAEFLIKLANEVSPELLTEEESLKVLAGRVETLKRILINVRRRMLLTGGASEPRLSSPSAVGTKPAPSRPVPVLSYLNRSKVYPPLLPPEYGISEVSFSKTLEQVEQRKAQDTPPHQLLDELVTASRLTWKTGADLLFNHHVIDRPIADKEIELVRRTRRFWTLYNDGRARYRTRVQLSEINSWSGDWAVFERAQLEQLLPDIILPDHFERREFLTRYIVLEKEACLDVHARNGKPLFKHPFPSKFDPLTFGCRT